MPVMSSPTRSRYSSNIMSRSASRMRCRMTCLAVCAAMRPKSSGVTSCSSIWSRYSANLAGPGCFLYADRSASSSAWRSFSSEMPFSRASACMASRISRDMALLLDEVRTVDVGVRDGDHAGGGGDRHLVVGRADELPGEGLVAVARLPRADAGTAAEVAVEVRRLGQRALAARRGHLERVALADVPEQVGDPLAEVERDAVGMVDEQPQRVAADDLGEQHFDVRRLGGQARLDVGLHAAHHYLLPDNKKAGSCPLSDLRRPPADLTKALWRR